MDTVRAFTFDPSNIHAIRRCEAPTMSFDSAMAGARVDLDLEGGSFPAGSVIDITISIDAMSGPAPSLYFVDAGGGISDPASLSAVGADQHASLTLTDETAAIQLHAMTGTLATWSKLLIDVTPPE